MKRIILVLVTVLTLTLSFSTVYAGPNIYCDWGWNDTTGCTCNYSDKAFAWAFEDFYDTYGKGEVFTMKMLGKGYTINKDIVLSGCKGATINIHDCKLYLHNNSRLFDIRSSNVTINFYNVSIYMDKDDYKGATNGGVFHLGGNKITIQSPDKNNPLLINGAHATNCGGAIKMDAYSNGSKISNVKFENCTADDDGGAIITNGNGNTIENCTFTNCTCKDAGGAIYVWDPCTVNGCTFTGNSAEAQEGISYGNDIYLADYLKLNGCTFTDHNKSQALYLYGDDYLTEDSENSFANNVSTILSEGKLWIIGGISVIAIAACVILITRKKRRGDSTIA